MSFLGRHKVYALFWPWNYEPFVCEADMVGFSGSKSVAQGQSVRFTLYPRLVNVRERGSSSTEHLEYRDILNPNDWFFLFVDPMDGERPEPLYLGMIDSVFKDISIDGQGMRKQATIVSCSGWEKAIRNVSAITSPFVHGNINIVTLLAMGPLGWTNRRDAIDAEAESSGSSDIGPFAATLPRLIETIVALFLHTSDSTGLPPSYADFISNARSTSDDRSLFHGSDSSIDPLFNGQFELPGTSKPLWDFIRMRFENIRERTYVDPRMFLNGTTQQLSSLIDQMCNPLINEVFYDVRCTDDDGLSSMDNSLVSDITGGYSQESMENFVSFARESNETFGALVENIAPYMVFRKRPLFFEELNELDGLSIDERDLVASNLGKSDSDVNNLVSIEIPSVSNQLIRAQSGFLGFSFYRERSMESIRRHGLRFYSDQATAWPMEVRGVRIEAPQPNPELLEAYEKRITKAGLDNPYVWSGSVTIPKFVRGLRIGGKLMITHNSVGDREITDRIYYIDSIDYTYEATTGAFSTSLALSRGYLEDGYRRAMGEI